MTLLGVAGLGLGTAFTGMLSHLTSTVSGEHAAALSGLFNTATRAGGVIGTAAFGTLYLALVHHPRQAVHGFAVLNLALAATALAAAAMAAVLVRRRSRVHRSVTFAARGGGVQRGGRGRVGRQERLQLQLGDGDVDRGREAGDRGDQAQVTGGRPEL
jgi:MFS family permease